MNHKKFNYLFWAALFTIVVVYVIGLNLDLMDIDASQYASISKEMFNTGRYLQVFSRGNDYLDKPPLIFWAACLSFKLFGIHDWAFRLPSVLILALGIYSTYRFSKLYYNEFISKTAILITSFCCATYLMTHDVRTDTMLTGWVMFSIWQLAEFNIHLKIKNIIYAAIGIGLAMLTKGPIGLVIPVIVFSADFIYKKQWSHFFRWQYILIIIIITLILIPMSIGLYEQFDLHPEKVAYNMKSPSGLKFFYWTQSFGRITGESYWDNNPDPFFLFHSFMWSFLPWTIFFIPAIFNEVKETIKNRGKSKLTEVLSVAGFVIIILFLSRSKYQLPHYTFCIHPLASIITAKYLYKLFFVSDNIKVRKTLFVIQNIIMGLIFVFALGLISFVFPARAYLYLIFISGFLGYLYFIFNVKTEKPIRFFATTLLPFTTLILILNLHFYPKLLSYQASSAIGKDLIKINNTQKHIIIYKTSFSYSFDFYSNTPLHFCYEKADCEKLLLGTNSYVLIDTADFEFIKSIKPSAKIIKTYADFHVTGLSLEFLNPATRQKTLEWKYLVGY
jgi:4-amino-4-deoxy-L-arabinose transferase-like glycosyltransferase